MKQILTLLLALEFLLVQMSCDKVQSPRMFSNFGYNKQHYDIEQISSPSPSHELQPQPRQEDAENSNESVLLKKKTMSFKSKPINYKGYSLDMSVESFKTMVKSPRKKIKI